MWDPLRNHIKTPQKCSSGRLETGPLFPFSLVCGGFLPGILIPLLLRAAENFGENPEAENLREQLELEAGWGDLTQGGSATGTKFLAQATGCASIC